MWWFQWIASMPLITSFLKFIHDGHTSFSKMMYIHHIHKWWTPIIFIFIGHPSYSLMMDIHNIWRLSYMTDIHHIWQTFFKYDGQPLVSNSNSMASKPLQEHKFDNYHWTQQYWLSNILLFIFQMKVNNCKIVNSHATRPKWAR